MINFSARDLQDPLYFANLEEKGEYLSFYSSKQLTVYLSYLKRYQRYLQARSESISFLWNRVNPPENYSQEKDVFAIHLKTPDDLDQTDMDRYRVMLKDIYEEDVRNLYYLEPQKDKGRKQEKQRLKVIDVFEDEETIIVDKMPVGVVLYPELSDLKVHREIQAFTKLLDRPDKHMIPLLMLSVPKRDAEWADPDPIDEPKWKILTNDSIAGIDAQREMVRKALTTPDFAILEGPPGSGKTTVISELILQLLEDGKRVLVVASTHVAVDNVLEKIVKYKELVVPVRIAPRDRNLPEDVERLTYSKYVGAFKDDLIRDLSAKKDRSRVENDWLQSIQGDDADEILQDLLDSTINVVCGTTIGVLQYPKIRSAIASGRFDPLFDVMIIDEASKTTFTEFLVPAMFAERWIISGDPKQLSPFIERGLIEDQVKGILDDIHNAWYGNDREGLTYKEYEEICLSSFKAMRALDGKGGVKKVSALLSIDGRPKKYAMALGTQIQSINPELIVHTSIRHFNDPVDLCVSMNTADVLLENISTLGEYQDCIPSDAIPVAAARLPLTFHYRRNYVFQGSKSVANRLILGQDDQDGKQRLDREIAWRIIRAYELKSLPERSRRYREQVNQLVPNWQSGNDDVDKKIKRVETISLPSVIEALILGIGDHAGDGSSVLVAGFDHNLKESRWQRLTHQLRMDTEISYFPRKFVYSDTTGKALSLKDGNIDRSWSYQRYSKRVSWLNTPGSEQKQGKHGGVWNPSEIEAVVEEVRSFVNWAEKNARNDDRPWEVAVLTFYDKQTDELKSRLSQSYGGKGAYFRIKRSNVKMFVGNVDSMQGREADVVFLSMVRTKHVGFLDSPNRLNVAITRSRYQLVILGEHGFFKNQNEDLLVTKLANEIIPEYKMGKGRGDST